MPINKEKLAKRQQAKAKRILDAVIDRGVTDLQLPNIEGSTDWRFITKGVVKQWVGKNKEGKKINHKGQVLGRPKKTLPVKLTKSQTRELFSQIFDLNAPEMFRIAFELAKTDKDMLKYLIDHRLGKPATTIAGDESAPLTLIVRRGTDVV